MPVSYTHLRAFDKGDMEECLEQFFRAIHSRYYIEKPVPRRLIRRKLGIINTLKEQNTYHSVRDG